MSRKRAFAGDRIETKDGRRGTILSYSGTIGGRWFIAFDPATDDSDATPNQEWEHRRMFYLLGEESNPFDVAPRNNIIVPTP